MTIHRARFLALGIAAVVLSAPLAACSTSSSQSTVSATGPILIGTSLSLSGVFAADGQAFMRGYELWAHDVNASGGLLGRLVKLDIKNDRSQPHQAIANYQTLIKHDKVDLLFGPFSSKLTIPTVAVADRHGFAFVEGAGGAPTVFATRMPDLFDVSQPVEVSMLPLISYLKSLPPGQRPTTAAFATIDDPFPQPQIDFAQQELSAAGIKSVYSQVFPAKPALYKIIAEQVVASKAQVVVLGSVDVPTVAAFTQVFVQQHYEPKVFVATSGPDQGAAYIKAVGGQSNADGVMVPNSWYGGSPNRDSRKVVSEYLAKYHGTASTINADVAEAYSVGEVMAQAVNGTGGLDQAKIIAYLHSHTMSSVQGPVKFDAVGQNFAATGFVFQWQKAKFVQVLPPGAGSVAVDYPKPVWSR